MHGDPWTDQANQELRQWSADGRSNREIAELTGRTEDAITQQKHRLGLRGGSATCQRCGASLMKKDGRPANYCSRACEHWARYEAEHGHRPLVEIKGVCAHCGESFARTQRPWAEGSQDCRRTARGTVTRLRGTSE